MCSSRRSVAADGHQRGCRWPCASLLWLLALVALATRTCREPYSPPSAQSAVSSDASNSLRESHAAGEMADGTYFGGRTAGSRGRSVRVDHVSVAQAVVAGSPATLHASVSASHHAATRLSPWPSTRRRQAPVGTTQARVNHPPWGRGTVLPRADGALRGGPEPCAIEIAQHRSLHLVVAVAGKANEARQNLMR